MNNAGKGRRFPTSPNPPLHLPTSLLQSGDMRPECPKGALKAMRSARIQKKHLAERLRMRNFAPQREGTSPIAVPLPIPPQKNKKANNDTRNRQD